MYTYSIVIETKMGDCRGKYKVSTRHSITKQVNYLFFSLKNVPKYPGKLLKKQNTYVSE